MGKPYISELEGLPDTYEWSMRVDVSPLANAISRAADLPLVATGSGGSLSAANVAAGLHQEHCLQIAKAATPLEIVLGSALGRDMSYLIVSAGGRNSDILSALKCTLAQEPKHIIVLCSRKVSPLTDLTRRYQHADLFDFDLPSGKDGFLATNSLLAFCVLLIRAYGSAFGKKESLPKRWNALVPFSGEADQVLRSFTGRWNPLWERQTLVVLHGVCTRAAALDCESKFTEAALGSVQVSDYRNFAHGRHHWLAKRGKSTAAIAFVTNEERALAKQMLRLFPSQVPLVAFDLHCAGDQAALLAIIIVFYLTASAGRARGIDPGRPGVPSFGRKLYHLKGLGSLARLDRQRFPDEAAAIYRKAGREVGSISREELKHWRAAYRSFLLRLKRTRFGAVVFDYDGTICDRRNRFTGISDAMARDLIRLLAAGVLVGVATGRGKSVKKDLQRKIPEALWPRITLGYYNGAQIGSLNEDQCPHAKERVCPELEEFVEALQSNPYFSQYAVCDFRWHQVSLTPKGPTTLTSLWETVCQVVGALKLPGVRLVRSNHSLDALAPGVSKTALLRVLATQLEGSSLGILCIGDSGRWPGNDHDLLRGPHSLSVDEVSFDAQTCWNLAPRGLRGCQAAKLYVRALVPETIGVRFRPRAKQQLEDE